MPTETWAVAYGPSRNGPQQIVFLDAILVHARAGQDSKTKAKQSKASSRGESGGFLAARLGEVFIDYAELTDCPLMGTTPGINP